jgi:hypothetical protein
VLLDVSVVRLGVTGVATLASLVATTADINAGTIDGTVIGGTTAAAISGTTGQFATSLNVDGTVTADGLTVDGAALVRSGNTLTLNRTDNAVGGAMSYVAGTGFIFNDVNGDGTSFNEGATNKFRIDSSGNVGIGTSSPSGKLDVSVASNQRIRFDDFGSKSRISSRNDAAAILPLLIDASDLILNSGSGGNVGIGTSSPDTLVQATNTSASTNYISYEIGSSGISSANKGGFAIYELGSLATSITYARDGTGHTDFNAETLVFNNAANTTEYMRIDSSGNVGIGLGAAAPLEKLHSAGRILSTTSYGSATQQVGTSIGQNAAVNATVDFRRWTGAGTNHGVGAIEVTDSGVMVFYTDSKTTNTVATSERMRIDASGNVGIGTSTPNSAGLGANGQTLQLGARTFIATDSSGDTRLGGLSGSNITAFYQGGTERMRIDVSGNVGIGTSSPSQKLDVKVATDAKLLVQEGNTAGNVKMQAVNNAVSLNTNLEIAALNTQFFNGGTERMRIDSSGNVGIGVVPSAWSVAVPALQLGICGAFLCAQGATEALYLGSNAYYNGTNWIYAVNAPATYYRENGGAHAWFNAPSGTTGDPITFTQAMTLDASGNLLVGDTSTVPFDGTSGVLIGGGRTSLAFATTGHTHKMLYSVNTGTAPGLHFYDSTNNRTDMIWDNSGNLLVGTTNTANLATHTPNVITDESFGINDGTNIAVIGLDRISFNAGNYYVLNESATGVKLVNGATSWTTQSDENSKENIVELSSALTAVNAMRCVRYNLKSQTPDDVKIGFIAQDWQSSYPEVVATDTDGTLGMNYTETIPVLLKAIQELSAQNAALTARIEALES